MIYVIYKYHILVIVCSLKKRAHRHAPGVPVKAAAGERAPRTWVFHWDFHWDFQISRKNPWFLRGRTNVNPGLINPKRLFNWEGTIYVSDYDYWRSTPLINKPWFINPGLTLWFMVDISIVHGWYITGNTTQIMRYGWYKPWRYGWFYDIASLVIKWIVITRNQY